MCTVDQEFHDVIMSWKIARSLGGIKTDCANERIIIDKRERNQ